MRSTRGVRGGLRVVLEMAMLMALWTALLAGCTTTHSTRTVGKGNLGLEATLGGPVTTNLGGPVPIPNLFLGARYGLRDDLDLSASLNATSPVIPGIALDLQTAAHFFPLQPERRLDVSGWSVGGSLGVDWLTDFQSGVTVLPYLEVAGGRRMRRFSPFAGAAVVLDLYRPPERTGNLMFSPFLGLEVLVGAHAALSVRGTLYDVSYNAWGSQVAWLYLIDDQEGMRRYAPVGVSFGFSWQTTQEEARAASFLPDIAHDSRGGRP